MTKFYGIGVGPGDPELLTLKAAETLRKLDVVIAPEKSKGRGSAALKIAKRYLKPDAKVLRMVFPMVEDRVLLKKSWKKCVETIELEIQKGNYVGFITLGDPMIYSTYTYVFRMLQEKGISIETIPGVPSFCACAAKAGKPLAQGRENLVVIPGVKNKEELENLLDNFKNVVVMKAGSHLDKTIELLEAKGFSHLTLVSQCGFDEEKVYHDLRDLQNKKIHYLSMIIAKKGDE
ncbi:Cobalt-precorrin-2 C(20)-methyltransferase [Koleobacter methoxysyntrophicus]|jgi:precorrin-2/cobalt-factor-2 C20-methyltransferase|uniref:Cobalt-precorrin-2 C(20)-methyltransferase n=1 Tax=Koleobacter methoxysyntrophicus TaxID=2751313 RepID=A0A8A0RPP5_9FIRM|nr:precorrin-2 C(20)-methyltransferase [Koleobacter methoxysyntrophicus]QSQ09377.1 Cobalt-precorrin-2 C(20)-methyltransferase [Koleobacter methoxysyntrophicus]